MPGVSIDYWSLTNWWLQNNDAASVEGRSEWVVLRSASATRKALLILLRGTQSRQQNSLAFVKQKAAKP
jgi:hypothetical protein